MLTRPIQPDDLAASVIAVPPLCRTSSLAIAGDENRRLVRHLEGGGIRILLYGGNANLYNIATSEFGPLLDLLEEIAGPGTHVIPSVGPHYGPAMDQAALLRDRPFPAAMFLPTTFPASPAGIQTAVRHFVERAGMPAVLYMKDERYLTAAQARELVDDGIIAFIKYAVVRPDPADDPLLAELVDLVDPMRIVSGIGEQPAPVHLRNFGAVGFTSGCVCVHPSGSMAVLRALKAGDLATAERLLEVFRPLEDLRNAHGPIPVLHHAVARAGIAATGPMLPLLADLPEALQATIGETARVLLSASIA